MLPFHVGFDATSAILVSLALVFAFFCGATCCGGFLELYHKLQRDLVQQRAIAYCYVLVRRPARHRRRRRQCQLTLERVERRRLLSTAPFLLQQTPAILDVVMPKAKAAVRTTPIFWVSNANTSGPGSFAAALAAANNAVCGPYSGAVLKFFNQLSGATIYLPASGLTIRSSVTIDASNLKYAPNLVSFATGPIFTVIPRPGGTGTIPVTFTNVNVNGTFAGIKLSGASLATFGVKINGGITGTEPSKGSVVLTRTTISSSNINLAGVSLQIPTGAVFTQIGGQDTGNAGGALNLYGGGTATISGALISGNQVAGAGQGVLNFSDGLNATISSCQIGPNSGTGVLNYGAKLTLQYSTIASCRPLSTAQAAGLVTNSSLPTMINNCTILGNTNPFGVSGGGIALLGRGGTTIISTTVAGNSAPGNGGGIYIAPGAAWPYIRNTLVQGNQAGSGNGNDVFGTVVSAVGNNNVIGDFAGSMGWAKTDINGMSNSTGILPLQTLPAGYYGGQQLLITVPPYVPSGVQVPPATAYGDQRLLGTRTENGPVRVRIVIAGATNPYVIPTGGGLPISVQ